MPIHHFSDLDDVIDGVHTLFDRWDADGTFADALGAEGLDVLRLAVHEWIANLVQHATFPDSRDVWLAVEAEGDTVRCVVEDSSSGFDFTEQIARQRAVLDRPVPSERGRGILMLVTCAEDLGYRPARPDENQRVTFTIRDRTDGALGGLFGVDDAHPGHMGDGSALAVTPPRPPSS